MTTYGKKQFPGNALLLVVFFIALLFLATLLLTIKKDVFFSGDAGLKYLVVKQMSKGGSFHTLELHGLLWVRDIWEHGFYPFKEPFIYQQAGTKIVSFPPAFQWLNVTFYRWFGFRGIYLVPCLSILLLWLCWIALSKRAGVKPVIIAGGFLWLAIGSPLTLYGAVYWEHTLAILLAFSAILYLVTPPAAYGSSVILGILTGTAVWFRPEMLVFCLLTSTMVFYNYYRSRSKLHLTYLLSVITLVTAFFLFNFLVYGSILGAHGYQVSATRGFTGIILEKCTILLHTNAKLIIYFPAIILLFILAVYLWRKPTSMPATISQLTVIVILYLLITPFILPNAGGKQWGPRYLLPVLPVVVTTLCLAVPYVPALTNRKWFLLLVPVVLYSVYLNGYRAHANLHDDYAFRVTPALDFLKRDTCDVLVVQNQFVAQEFASLFESKKIFLAEDQESFDRLNKFLHQAGVFRILYMAADPDKILMPGTVTSRRAEVEHVGAYYIATYHTGAEHRIR